MLTANVISKALQWQTYLVVLGIWLGNKEFEPVFQPNTKGITVSARLSGELDLHPNHQQRGRTKLCMMPLAAIYPNWYCQWDPAERYLLLYAQQQQSRKSSVGTISQHSIFPLYSPRVSRTTPVETKLIPSQGSNKAVTV